MPVPGPRTQFGPLPGYTNPGLEQPHRINLWLRPPPVAEEGRTPGLMDISLRGCVLAAGQIRRMWKQSINEIFPQAPYSWPDMSPSPGRHGEYAARPGLHYPPIGITRAFRYMTRSVYMGSGEDNTRFPGLHTRITPRHRAKPVTLGAGLVQNRPTVRNRMTSFGSRVPTLNQPVPAAQPPETQQ